MGISGSTRTMWIMVNGSLFRHGNSSPYIVIQNKADFKHKTVNQALKRTKLKTKSGKMKEK
jgi:hypothetical protein